MRLTQRADYRRQRHNETESEPGLMDQTVEAGLGWCENCMDKTLHPLSKNSWG